MTICTFTRSSPIFDEIEARASAKRGDEAFRAALNRATKRGKEHVVPGTFVDTSPAVHAKRLIGESARSVFSSPAAMCAG